MTDNDILIEYEAHLAASGETKVTCPRCGYSTFRDTCIKCKDDSGGPLPLTGARELDDLEKRLEAGEDVDLTEFFSTEEETEVVEPDGVFEPVKIEDLENSEKE